jgi:trehalose utilization protein
LRRTSTAGLAAISFKAPRDGHGGFCDKINTMRIPRFSAVGRCQFGLVFLFLLAGGVVRAAGPIRVVVWDEQQPQQRMTYSNWLGGQIADHLRAQPGLRVTTSRLDDPEQGLGPDVLDHCDVLIWWGHVRNGEVSVGAARDIVRRIQAGQLALIALHSAHWSAPFMEAMNVRAREDALRALPPQERAGAVFRESNLFPNLRTPPKSTDRLTPAAIYRKPIGGPVEIELTLPNCCFPAYRPDAMPSRVRVLLPQHPIAHGLPPEFTIAQTEMYDEPFHVPPPDEVVLQEHWEHGEWFRSGSVWNLGKGKIFYFRPGHELYPVFKNPDVLKVLDNAVRWLGKPES